MIVITPCFEQIFAKTEQHANNIVFHSLLYYDFISLQFKSVLKCNRCHDDDNVKEHCMCVQSKWLLFGLIFRFADIFKFQIKKVFNDSRNVYAMSFNYMMLWKCYNINNELSVSWLLCVFLAVLTTNRIKMQIRWFM
jgi:hypothetical protein